MRKPVVLITGAGGEIGHGLIDHLAREGRQPVIRRALLDRFPYAIAFEQRGDSLMILAFAHLRRRPLYWLARASSAR